MQFLYFTEPMPKSPSNYFSWLVLSHSKWDKVVLQLCRALLSGRGHDHFVKLLPLGLAIKSWVKFLVMQGWGEKVFAYSSSGVRPWAWNYFDRNNWRLRLRLCDQNPLSSLFVLHFRLLFVKKIINNWSSDLISDEFWAEAINISQWSETWLTKKNSENVFLNPTDSYLVGFQQKRGFKDVELRPLYLYETAFTSLLKS